MPLKNIILKNFAEDFAKQMLTTKLQNEMGEECATKAIKAVNELVEEEVENIYQGHQNDPYKQSAADVSGGKKRKSKKVRKSKKARKSKKVRKSRMGRFPHKRKSKK